MLVLSRNAGGEIQIGNDIRILVVTIGGGRVKLGIKAPEDVVVYRGELGPMKPESRESGLTGLEADMCGSL